MAYDQVSLYFQSQYILCEVFTEIDLMISPNRVVSSKSKVDI